jgi:type II secretory pathway component HofQ
MLPSSARRWTTSASEAAVTPQTLAQRVEILEQEVEKQEILPDRVTALEVQISEFRAEVRAEFSATRTELRQEMRALHDQTRAGMQALNDQTLGRIDETRAQMRALHEDVIDRLKVVDIRPARKPANGPRRKR